MIEEWRQECQDNFHILTSADGTELFLRDWTTAKNPNTAFVLFHGITAHSEPYRELMIKIADVGFAAYGFDLRGHGLSGGKRGDYKSGEQLYQDFATLLEFLQSHHERIIPIGHSMGVITASMFAQKFQDQLSGLALLSAARTFRAGAFPKTSLLTMLKILTWGVISPSRPVVHYYREGMRGYDNPKFNFDYTPRFFRVIGPHHIKFSSSMQYPVFVAVGDQDELFAESDVRKFYEEIPADQKKFAILRDTKHAIFNEHSFDELYQWIEENFNNTG